MDASHLFRSIDAGDLTPGASLVSYTPRGDGPELTILDVIRVDGPERLPGAHHAPNTNVCITVRDPHGAGDFTMVLRATTKVIATGRALLQLVDEERGIFG